MIDHAAIEAFDPLDDPPARSDYRDVGFSARVEADRLGALMFIHRARDSLAALADVLRTDPGPAGDALADALADRFGEECQAAGEHIRAMRDIRECQG